ncbi:MAG: maleate cis-trans isomerase family protein [Sphingobium sp.]
MKTYRIGQIVPSSNTTMETEIPAMLRARRELVADEAFSFHSSRMRMRTVSKEELSAMDREAVRCAAELADARVDVMGYACLVAIMSQGLGYHRTSEARLTQAALAEGAASPVISSAGALVEALATMTVKKVAIVTPYVKSLTRLVVDYIEHEGYEVTDCISLEIEDNLAVGRRDPLALVEISQGLNVTGADAVVLSACVQMPSLAAVPIVEEGLGRPVVTAAVATTHQMLRRLGLRAEAPGCGALLAGGYR